MIISVTGNKAKFLSNSKQYDGEKIPGDLNKWDYFGTDPNLLLTYTYDILSQRSTTLYHTHPPVASAINKLTTYAVGSGLVFRSQPDWQVLEIDRQYAKEWGMRFQKLIHYMFTLLNYYEKQNIIFRTANIMGDSLQFFDRSYSDDGLGFDIIEAGGDTIDFAKKGDSEKNITLGIEHDQFMRRKGIWKTDGKYVPFKDANKDQNVIQYYTKNMCRQLRGMPLAYRIISAAKNNDRYWDAIGARAVLEATILGSSKSATPGDMSEQAKRLAELATNQTEASTQEGLRTSGNIADQRPGTVFEFGNKDGGIEWADMKTPSNNFDKFQTAYIEIVGMACDGIPPEVIMSKYSTSYTAHKGAFNDFIQIFKMKRRGFAQKVVKPTIIECAKWLFLNKMIEMPHPLFFENRIFQEATVAGNYLGTVPGHINPAQEVAAKALEVEKGFDLRSNKAMENGHEWDNFLEEWQQEEEAYRKNSPEQQALILQKEMAEKEEENENNNNDNNQNNDNDQNDENSENSEEVNG